MYKLFSERKKEQQGLVNDVYIYNSFPEQFRNQFFAILKRLFNENKIREYAECRGWSINTDIWGPLCESFAQEKGLKAIYYRNGSLPNTSSAFEYYADRAENEDFLDLLDFSFSAFIDCEEVREVFGDEAVNDAIEELNYRLKQHSLGYEFIDGHLIEKTNEHIHKEIIKPTIHLLSEKEFEGANEEFFNAFECYKQGDNKGAIINAEKSLESTLKVICTKMGYQFDKNTDTAKKLIDTLKTNNFFPNYLSNHLNTLCAILENGTPTVRNKTSGHGQGEQIQNVSNELAEYELNLVATNIVFLVKIYQSKAKN